jgi:HEPN domain-containing protein
MSNLEKITELLQANPELADKIKEEAVRIAETRTNEIALGLIPEAVKNILGLELSEEDLDEFVEAAREIDPDDDDK